MNQEGPYELHLNLRFLCAERASAAQVCRDIGIHPQQFSKYLTARSQPSAHNMRRIAQYFNVAERDLAAPHAAFLEALREDRERRARVVPEPLSNAFPGDLRALRGFLGAYHVFFQAPAAGRAVMVSAAFLDERDGLVHSRVIEAPSGAAARRGARSDGLVTHRGQQLYVVDQARRGENALSAHILTTTPARDQRYLFGVTAFLASAPHAAPAASRVVWRRCDGDKSVRDVIRSCGSHPIDSPHVEPAVRRHLEGGSRLGA